MRVEASQNLHIQLKKNRRKLYPFLLFPLPQNWTLVPKSGLMDHSWLASSSLSAAWFALESPFYTASRNILTIQKQCTARVDSIFHLGQFGWRRAVTGMTTHRPRYRVLLFAAFVQVLSLCPVNKLAQRYTSRCWKHPCSTWRQMTFEKHQRWSRTRTEWLGVYSDRAFRLLTCPD